MFVAGLYFHIPFRTARRPYDDAYYITPVDAPSEPDVERFVRAIDAELRLYGREYAADEPVHTLYAGGGRPSLLSLKHARTLLSTVVDVFDASAFQESTAEISPLDATESYLNGLLNVGFDRLSIEVLSFYADELRTLKAPHTASAAIRAIRTVRHVGFRTFSVDLAFGWPEQSMDRWADNLQQVIDMEIPSVTLIECPMETTPSDLNATDDAPSRDAEISRDAEMKRAKQFRLAIDMLESHGYEAYELTHFAKPGHASSHLQNTYAHGSYIGVGPSAESFWWPDRAGDRSARRWTNVSDVDEYTQLLKNRYPPVAYRQTSSWASLAREYIFLRLRTATGLNLIDLQNRYRYDVREKNSALLNTLAENDLVAGLDNGYLRLTPAGRLVADGITERLLPS